MRVYRRLGLARDCAPLVLALAAALTLACATTRPVEEQIDDGSVTVAIGSKLVLDPEISRYRIDIDTLKGVVTLHGAVENDDQRREVERISKATDGVLDVVNHLEIDTEPRTTAAQFEDGQIGMIIDSKLIVDPEVHSRNVHVDVADGVVTLSGIVESAIARSEAEQLAGSVDGVVRVVNELTVVDG